MKIAVIVKSEEANSKTYIADKNKVTSHPENLFLSAKDKNALEYALQLLEINGGTIDAYTFAQSEVAERSLHEALAMGANTATKIVAGDINDPLQQNQIANEFAHYLKKCKKSYDLILTGSPESSEFFAAVATKLGIACYNYISAIDTSLNYEMKLERGKIIGQCTLPAIICTLDTINVPRIASFTALSKAINSNIDNVALKKHKGIVLSKIMAKPIKKEKMILNLKEDPKATQRLISALKQNGILR